MAVVGYGRVSTNGQELALQEEALKEYGCERIYMEKESGAKSNRVELEKALDFVRPGDKLVVYKIDRLARSTFDLETIANRLEKEGVTLIFIKENIDFSTASGKMMFTMLGAIAQFERDLIMSRTAEGRERAKAKGTHMGRIGKPEKDVKKAMKMYKERESNGLSVKDIEKATGVPRSTIYAKAKELKGVEA